MPEFEKFTEKQQHPNPGKQGVIEDLQRVAEKIGHPPNSNEYPKHGKFTMGAVNHHFESIADALRAADLDPDERVHRNHIPEEDLILDLQAGAELLGRPPKAREVDAWGEYSSSVYRQRFGSWPDALEAAGLVNDDGCGE